MADCEFCRKLSEYKSADDYWDKIDKENGVPRIYHEYTVALVARFWTKEKGKRHASRSTDYRNQGIGYKLNYCPECGKDLRRAAN